jgi:hypothetical protein
LWVCVLHFCFVGGRGLVVKWMRDSGLCLDIMWALCFSTMCFLYKPLGTMFFWERLFGGMLYTYQSIVNRTMTTTTTTILIYFNTTLHRFQLLWVGHNSGDP